MRSEPWIELLAAQRAWRDCYPIVAHKVCAALAGETEPISTSALAEALWPVASVEGVIAVKCRQRLFQALKAMATRELAAYARRGEAYQRKVFNHGRWVIQTARPWLWADYGIANVEAITRPKCPHCGGEL